MRAQRHSANHECPALRGQPSHHSSAQLAFFRRSAFWTRLLALASLPHPSSEAKRGQAQNGLSKEAAGSRLGRVRVDELAVDFRLRRGRRARAGAALGHGHPACDVGERLRRADGTLLRVVYFFAIVAQPGLAELHRHSVPRCLRRGSRRATISRASCAHHVTRRAIIA
jgi:hypothetical protein